MEGGWFFNPLSWQFLFTIGFALGTRRVQTGQAVPYNRAAWWLAAGFLLLSLTTMRFHLVPEAEGVILRDFLLVPEKQYLSVPRLLHLMALAYVVVHSPLQRWAARLPHDNPFSMMGRHSLPVFCTGLVISMLGVTLRLTGHDSLGFDLIYVAIGLGTQLLAGWLLTLAEKRRGGRAPTAPAAFS
jgi:hypothetical protein